MTKFGSIVAIAAAMAVSLPAWATAAPVKECGNYDPFTGEFTYKQIQGAGVFNITSRA